MIAEEIERRIRQNFDVIELQIIDESHKHKGHAGYNPEGESHFRIKLISPDFKDMGRVERQRKIYILLDDLLKSRIHALSLSLSGS